MGQGLGAASSRKVKIERLLDKYTLGAKLGVGAFGVVHSCTEKETGRGFAVKRINKHRTAKADVDREVRLLRRVAHPCIVQLHGVYSNAVSVDLVLDLHSGGDMVTAMQLHWDSKGDIPLAAVRNLSRQIFQAVEWLHRNSVVHGDIKGENFLLDQVDLEHPECRVCLTDFGTAVEANPGRRLTQDCGTELYWAPERYAQNYSFKIDVWAAAVLVYGLATGTFPFMDKEQVLSRTPRIPASCGEAGKSFLLAALERAEARRLTAHEALEHPFLALVEFHDTTRDEATPTPMKQKKAIKLIDFDTCQEYEPMSPKAKHVVGTMGYIAPEALQGEYSPSSDLWSVGVILYILMTGDMPFPPDVFGEDPSDTRCGSSSMNELYNRLQGAQIDFDCEPWPSFPQARDLCMNLLAFSPGDRSPSARAALNHPWLIS